MKAHTDFLLPEKIYHIYNRGIDGTTIFRKEYHYKKFLEKYKNHVHSVVNTYAYCLLPNHFHALIRVRSKNDIIESFPYLAHKPIERIISNQFAHLFNGYAQYFNHNTNRTGALFEHQFRRIEVDNLAYFNQLIVYIHKNPTKHGITDDYKDYTYSSYHSIISDANTRLQRQDVLTAFGDIEHFQLQHQKDVDWKNILPFTIEFD
jgi:REP element-mobilizing transposase RayT